MKVEFRGNNLTIEKGMYHNGNLALSLEDDGELYLVMTVNFDEVLPEGYVYIKDYSENEGVLEMLIKEGLVLDVVGSKHTGYVEVPYCKIDMEKVDELG